MFEYGPNFKPWFTNPATKEDCYIFFDMCHMIKLVRNTLGDKKNIFTSTGDVIEWNFIEMLHELQKSEGLVIANKLSNKHVNFQNNRMNVRLAMQVLSESVSKALIFLTKINDAHLRNQFKDCLATAKFCCIFNSVSDVLNCKNKFSKKTVTYH